MPRVAIIGSSDLALLISHHVVASGHTISGYFDNLKPKGLRVADFGEVAGDLDCVQNAFDLNNFDLLMVAVGYLQLNFREISFNRFKGKIPFANIVHPTAIIDESVIMGEGIFVGPGCIVDFGAQLMDNVFLNAGSLIAHHTQIGSHTFVAPAASVAGKVRIGRRCFIGINATVIDHLNLCDDTMVGAASLVVRNTTSPGWYVGVPAKDKDVSNSG